MLRNKHQYYLILSLLYVFVFSMLLSPVIFALSFSTPQSGDTVIGMPRTTEIQEGEDFSDIALRNNIGFYELYETNPSLNPDDPPKAVEVIVPTQYILPQELRENMILINLAEMHLYYRPAGKGVVYVFPVGIGKVDWDSPLGMMHVADKIAHPSWVVPQDVWKFNAAHGNIYPHVIPPGPENPMGSYKLRLSSSVGAYYIHGTNLPAGVGRRSSAGCIRLYEPDIKLLFFMVKVGTPVQIINQPYKAGWLNGKLYLEAHLPLFEQRMMMDEGDHSLLIDAIEQANKTRHVAVDWQKAFRVADEHVGVPRLIQQN
ncbi:MAG: hypothetical protein A2X78_04530 [Gammaproteobacteria bacterium GWE2_37_16]|nr:MAG: hypothetical protein A2X78_04530 [Gammaproteobacteria bacterium GWE2_37_16]